MENVINDIALEGIAIGCLTNKPELFNEYLDLIVPQYDFTDENLKFLYNLLVSAYLNNSVINETSINIEASKLDEYDKELFKTNGGFKSYERLSRIAEVQDDFKKVYNKLKTFNLLRELQRKGFNVTPYVNKLKEYSPDEIIAIYEKQLAKIGVYIKGINGSIEIGKGMIDFYERLKVEPDIGVKIPFPLIHKLARGWRKGKIYASGMHSGMGKSREIAYMLTQMSIINDIPVLLIVNEQDEEEWRLMLLTSVVNNVFGKKLNITVDEDEIASGVCEGIKDDIVRQSAEFIEKNSKIQFLETNVYDYNSLKIVLKQHKLQGYEHVIIDTFKPFRGGKDDNGLAEWQNFVYTVERMKRIVGSAKKGGLEIALWITFQLTDESLITKTLNSSAIASGKQIKHNLDFIKMSRQIEPNEYQKIKVRINMPNNKYNGEIQELNTCKTYYLTIVDKNRGGKDKKKIIYEVDKGKVIFTELGEAILSSNFND